MKRIIFLTGASGVGNTSLVESIEANHRQFKCYHFDSIGVPKLEDMEHRYGSAENWQKAMTGEWVSRLVSESNQHSRVVIEGQVNIEFIFESFNEHNVTEFEVYLISCSIETLFDRLINKRNQPELANERMANWLPFLSKQAEGFNVIILDTDDLSVAECCDVILNN